MDLDLKRFEIIFGFIAPFKMDENWNCTEFVAFAVAVAVLQLHLRRGRRETWDN